MMGTFPNLKYTLMVVTLFTCVMSFRLEPFIDQMMISDDVPKFQDDSMNMLLMGQLPVDPLQLDKEVKWSIDPVLSASVGDISGISTGPDGNLSLFTRQDRKWEEDTFDDKKVFTKKSAGPIKNDTIVVINPTTGKKLMSGGSSQFYMPHGITVDPAGNTWVTDVALHQVFRYPKGDLTKPNLVLGESFTPGNDDNHFCQPTDVAVSSTGISYISDGYCNSRIVIVSPEGKVLGKIATDDLNVPHSLTLMENDDVLCVADREGRRIACYSAGMVSEAGNLVSEIRPSQLGRVFAIDHWGETIYAVNGPDVDIDQPFAAAMDLGADNFFRIFSPESGFLQPHDITVSPDGSSLFVTDIDPKASQKVYKFDISYQ